MGNRLAEMQLRDPVGEIMQRFHTVEVVAEPGRVKSNFVRGYTSPAGAAASLGQLAARHCALRHSSSQRCRAAP